MPLPTDPQAVGSNAVETFLAAGGSAGMRAAMGLGTLATQSGNLSDYLLAATAANFYAPRDLIAPNGNRYRISVNNSGQLITTLV
jgi:hypothetical protein